MAGAAHGAGAAVRSAARFPVSPIIDDRPDCQKDDCQNGYLLASREIDDYLRSADESWCPVLEKRFRDIVKGAELMTGATAEIAPFRPAYRARKPNTPMNMDYAESMRAQGQEVEIPKSAGRGSSDFGNFSQIVPGIHPYFAVSDTSVPVPHSKEFAACAGKDFGFDNALRAAAALAHEALRFMTDPAFREAVKADFARR